MSKQALREAVNDAIANGHRTVDVSVPHLQKLLDEDDIFMTFTLGVREALGDTLSEDGPSAAAQICKLKNDLASALSLIEDMEEAERER